MAATVLLNFMYRRGIKRVNESPLPVISVGNLTYGGTNKTPFVEMLCRNLQNRGKAIKVGVVSRGYGGSLTKKDAPVLVTGEDRKENFSAGDEPQLLAARVPGLPVAVSRDRLKGLELLKDIGVELVVADDAFQHRRLSRDVDIVLVDSSCPFGNGSLVPAGILREPVSALSRAGFVVLTKVDQAPRESLKAIREIIERYVPEENIFSARLEVGDWAEWDGEMRPLSEPVEGRRILAFSGIGNPESFSRSLQGEGVEIVAERRFKDHHRYSESDMNMLHELFMASGAESMVCTEKDLYNLPSNWRPPVQLLVPRVAVAMDEPDRFFTRLTEALKPRVVVASNGYGEDAIGVLLAKKLKRKFPSAEVLSFPLVGRGDVYRNAGFEVKSTPSVTPSGGVIKYHLRDLWRDLRAGLLRHVSLQIRDWGSLHVKVRTPLCVGDVYLLLHTLWGSGIQPLFIATAKTVNISGHLLLERYLIRHFSRRTWTRDTGSAEQLASSQANSTFAGSPIMDLLGDMPFPPPPSCPAPDVIAKVLLLPGSRIRAYSDAKLLLDAAELLQGKRPCSFLMVLAPTLSISTLTDSCEGWTFHEDLSSETSGYIEKDGLRIELTCQDVAFAANGAVLLIGLGGTANQLCAGMGLPVVSIEEKGKLVQKKLLGDSELLVKADPDSLADCAFMILSDPELYKKMSDTGIERMGPPGALDSVVEYAASELGWALRCEIYERLLGK